MTKAQEIYELNSRLNRLYLFTIKNSSNWNREATNAFSIDSLTRFNDVSLKYIRNCEADAGDDLPDQQIAWLIDSVAYMYCNQRITSDKQSFNTVVFPGDPPLNKKTSQDTIKSINASIYTQYLIASKVWKDNASMFIKGHDIADFVDYSNRCLDIRTKELDLESLTPTERSQILAELRQFAIDKYLPKETNIMNTTAFETKHFIFGQEASTMTDEQLIEAIKKIEKEISELGSIKSSSKNVNSKVAKLENMLAAVVIYLDSK
jgi:hypothetical protein